MVKTYCHQQSINYLKAKRLLLVPMDVHEFHLHDEPPEQVDTIDIKKVKMGIEKLPMGYKQILSLYLIEGYDHNEIGEILEVSTSTSKSQYHRAKKKLIEIIKAL